MAASTKTMAEKIEIAAPYNIFNNVVPEVPETMNQDNAIAFTDLLCPSLGKLKCSLQITSKIDIKWLMQQYESRGLRSKPLTILYGEENPELEEYVAQNLPNVTQHCVTVSDYFGSHHAKMSIYVYEDDSVRVVISTANLYQNHWDHFNHGFWVGPLCPRLVSQTNGESPTNFKSNLINYLQQYRQPGILNVWIDYIKLADFSDVKVCLVTSYPGIHGPATPLGSHVQCVSNLLKKHCQIPTDEEKHWPIIIQTSCIGQFGGSPDNWFRTFLSTLASHMESKASSSFPEVQFKVIYPSYRNVKNGHFGSEIGQGLRYFKAMHDKQTWLNSYFYQWKSDSLNRSKIMAHLKSYCRLSPCNSKMAWFLLTSANATRGAWAKQLYPNDGRTRMENFEVGVMFLPKFFDEDYFKVKTVDHNIDEKVFPMFYDVPLTKYQGNDGPWTVIKKEEFKQKCIWRMRSSQRH